MNRRSFGAWLWKLLWKVTIAYWIALLVGTHWPQPPAIGPSNFDKVLHFAAYGGLAILLTLSVAGPIRTMWWSNYAFIFVGLAVAGGLDELTQPPFHRTADWFDWFADLAGICAGIALGALIRHWLRPRTQHHGDVGE